jgi:hypothetical protein
VLSGFGSTTVRCRPFVQVVCVLRAAEPVLGWGRRGATLAMSYAQRSGAGLWP